MNKAIVVLALFSSACREEPASGPAVAALDTSPPSAYAALRELRKLVDGTAAAAIFLQEIECKTILVKSENRSLVEARMDVAVSAADSIQATRICNELFAAIEAAEWCREVRRASTRAEEPGLVVPGVTVLIDPRGLPEAERGAVAVSGSEELEVYARIAAARQEVGIGQIECSRRTQTPARGVEETVYRFRPMSKQSSFALGSLDAFFQALEGFQRGVITSIDVSPADKKTRSEPVGRWLFEVEMTLGA